MGRECPKDKARKLEETMEVVSVGLAEAQARPDRLREPAFLTYREGNMGLASGMGSAILALEVSVESLQAVLAEIGCRKRR